MRTRDFLTNQSQVEYQCYYVSLHPFYQLDADADIVNLFLAGLLLLLCHLCIVKDLPSCCWYKSCLLLHILFPWYDGANAIVTSLCYLCSIPSTTVCSWPSYYQRHTQHIDPIMCTQQNCMNRYLGKCKLSHPPLISGQGLLCSSCRVKVRVTDWQQLIENTLQQSTHESVLTSGMTHHAIVARPTLSAHP